MVGLLLCAGIRYIGLVHCSCLEVRKHSMTGEGINILDARDITGEWDDEFNAVKHHESLAELPLDYFPAFHIPFDNRRAPIYNTFK